MYAQIACVYVGSDMTLREAGFMWFYIMLGLGTIYWIVAIIKNNAYQAGFWSGRSAGWKSCIEHQAKINQMKIDQVFDYDKN
jgi:hypothetical protein